MPIQQAVCQIQDVDESIAAYARQLGIGSINLTTPKLPHPNGYWEVDDLIDIRKRCSDLGLTLEVIENTAHDMYDKVMLGLPGRDEQLDGYCTTIRNMARADIPILGFHFMPTAVWRTDMAAPARGGAIATAYDHSRAADGNKVAWPADAGDLRLSAEQMWDNYRVFLEAVLPVADEVGVKLAQHPDDPPVNEINGFARIFTSPANFKRAHQMAGGSDAWGLDLCLGTISEMVGGAKAVEEMIGFFGPLGKIRYVHLRDVQGTVPVFQECFLGEGNYDPPTVIRQLVDVGFDGWLQDDHVPTMSDDTTYGHRARAHAIGYIQGVLAAVDK